MGIAITANDKLPLPRANAIGENMVIDLGQASEDSPTDTIGTHSLHEGTTKKNKTTSQAEGGASRRKAKRYVTFCLIPQVGLHLTNPLPFHQVSGT